MRYLSALLFLFPALCFAQDRVRVQVLMDGDAIYLPLDKYCTDEQVAKIFDVLGVDQKTIDTEKSRRAEERKKAEEAAAQVVAPEPTEADLQKEVDSIDAQIADLQAQKEARQAAVSKIKADKLTLIMYK